MFLGIDPGTGGAAVLIDRAGSVQRVLPWTGESDFAEALTDMRDDITHAVLEKVNAFPGQGVASTWVFGQNYGFIRGVLCSLRIRHTLVLPTAWQSGLMLPKRASKTAHKNDLKDAATRLLPSHRWTLKTADAALLALYAKDAFSSPANRT